jgi:hypothetical protein
MPQNSSTMSKKVGKKTLKHRIIQTKLREFYLARFSQHPSGISNVLANPDWIIFQDLAFSIAGRSFTTPTDLIILRELLLRIQRNWAEIKRFNDSVSTCPIFISDDELRKHQMDGKQWNEFKDALKSRNFPINRAG